jgi:hypothetical protein
LASLATAALLLPATTAQALLVEFEMTGHIGRIIDPGDGFGGQFLLDMPFTGYGSWDTSLVDLELSSSQGRYSEDPAGTLINLSMSVGGLEITTAPVSGGNAFVSVLPNTDNFYVVANSPNTNGMAVSLLELHLTSGSSNTFPNDALPTYLELADFDFTHTLSFATSVRGNLGIVYGTIDTLTMLSERPLPPEPGPVPEPTAALLFALGLAVAAGPVQRARRLGCAVRA